MSQQRHRGPAERNHATQHRIVLGRHEHAKKQDGETEIKRALSLRPLGVENSGLSLYPDYTDHNRLDADTGC